MDGNFENYHHTIIDIKEKHSYEVLFFFYAQ